MPSAAREHHPRPAHGADLPIGTLLASLASRSDLSDLLGCRTRQIICQTNHQAEQRRDINPSNETSS
jgi:hypothetical protein